MIHAAACEVQTPFVLMLQCALPHSTNASAGILSLAVRAAAVALAVFKDARTLSSSAHSRSWDLRFGPLLLACAGHLRMIVAVRSCCAYVLAVCHPGVRVQKAQVAGAATAHAFIATCACMLAASLRQILPLFALLHHRRRPPRSAVPTLI